MDEDLDRISRKHLTAEVNHSTSRHPIRHVPPGLLLLLLACTYWEPYSTPATAPPQRLPSTLRVTPATGPPTLLVEPYLRSDTLFGRSGGDTLKFPLEQLQRLERQWVDGLRTTGLILGTTALLTVVGLYTGGLE